MNFVVGPFYRKPYPTAHILRVEYNAAGDDGLDYHNGRTLCGRRGVVRSGLMWHRIQAVVSKLGEAENACQKCASVAERWMR